ncbi:helicase [Vibrio phage D260]
MARRQAPEISQEQYETAFMLREDGATKRAQCDALGIKYNTSRLDKLLDEEEERRAHRKEMMKKMRKKAVTPTEKANMVQEYLQTKPVGAIAESYYRTTQTVKRVLEEAGVLGLVFQESPNPLKPALVPDDCMSETFAIGQKVWVPGYRCLGEVVNEYTDQPSGVNAYRVYLLEASLHRNVIFSAADLGSLEHLKELGVNIDSLQNNIESDEIKVTLGEALKKAKMKPKDRK